MLRGFFSRASRDGLSRRDAALEALRHAVLDAPANSDPSIRRAWAFDESDGSLIGDYAVAVRDSSYKITDAVIKRLRLAGHSEDEVFEVTVAAALGASLTRLEAAVALLGPEA